MIYEYRCLDESCGNIQEGFRKVADREDTPECKACGGEMTLMISICGGFKVPGAYNPNFQARGGKSRYLFDAPVGPMDSRSKAHQKKQDDENSTHYGPGQSCSMSSSEFKQYSQRRDDMEKGRTKF